MDQNAQVESSIGSNFLREAEWAVDYNNVKGADREEALSLIRRLDAILNKKQVVAEPDRNAGLPKGKKPEATARIAPQNLVAKATRQAKSGIEQKKFVPEEGLTIVLGTRSIKETALTFVYRTYKDRIAQGDFKFGEIDNRARNILSVRQGQYEASEKKKLGQPKWRLPADLRLIVSNIVKRETLWILASSNDRLVMEELDRRAREPVEVRSAVLSSKPSATETASAANASIANGQPCSSGAAGKPTSQDDRAEVAPTKRAVNDRERVLPPEECFVDNNRKVVSFGSISIRETARTFVYRVYKERIARGDLKFGDIDLRARNILQTEQLLYESEQGKLKGQWDWHLPSERRLESTRAVTVQALHFLASPMERLYMEEVDRRANELAGSRSGTPRSEPAAPEATSAPPAASPSSASPKKENVVVQAASAADLDRNVSSTPRPIPVPLPPVQDSGPPPARNPTWSSKTDGTDSPTYTSIFSRTQAPAHSSRALQRASAAPPDALGFAECRRQTPGLKATDYIRAQPAYKTFLDCGTLRFISLQNDAELYQEWQRVRTVFFGASQDPLHKEIASKLSAVMTDMGGAIDGALLKRIDAADQWLQNSRPLQAAQTTIPMPPAKNGGVPMAARLG